MVDLHLVGQERPIGETLNQRVFSADRGMWIEAGELRARERVVVEERGTLGLDAPGNSPTYRMGQHSAWTTASCDG